MEPATGAIILRRSHPPPKGYRGRSLYWRRVNGGSGGDGGVPDLCPMTVPVGSLNVARRDNRKYSAPQMRLSQETQELHYPAILNEAEHQQESGCFVSSPSLLDDLTIVDTITKACVVRNPKVKDVLSSYNQAKFYVLAGKYRSFQI